MELYSQSRIPTSHGSFDFSVFKKKDGEEITVLSLGDFDQISHDEVFVRIHSECVTSEVFGSLKCDCKEQLDLALGEIQSRGKGILIYLKQEGRGIGLGNKIKAYHLQEKGLDTVEANHQLGFDTDLREYSDATEILKYFKVENVTLNTNNPDKIAAVKKAGVAKIARRPSIAKRNIFNSKYIDTKKEKCGHLF